MSYQTLLNKVAQVVGGTQPDPTNNPYWFSGLDKGDSTGVAGIAGCYSLPQNQFNQDPVGMVLGNSWQPLDTFPTQGHKYREDLVVVRIFAGHDDIQLAAARLAGFADTVPAMFDTHMQLLGESNVLTAWCSRGRFIEVNWPPLYLVVEFQLQIQRAIPTTYTG